MRTIPFKAPADPPGFWEAITGFFETVASAVCELTHSIINALTTALSTIINAIQGVLSAIVAGVRLLISGIMACVNFIAKLFSDAIHFLIELGQKIWGAIQDAINAIVSAVKCILYWISWILAQICAVFLEMMKMILGISGIVKGGWGILECNLKNQNLRANISIRILEFYWTMLDLTLWSLNISIVILFTAGYSGFIAIIPMILVDIIFKFSNMTKNASGLIRKCYYSPELKETRMKSFVDWMILIIGGLMAVAATFYPICVIFADAQNNPFLLLLTTLPLLDSPLLVALILANEVMAKGTVLDHEAVIGATWILFWFYVVQAIIVTIIAIWRAHGEFEVEKLLLLSMKTKVLLFFATIIAVFSEIFAFQYFPLLASVIVDIIWFVYDRLILYWEIPELSMGSAALIYVKNKWFLACIVPFLMIFALSALSLYFNVSAHRDALMSSAIKSIPSIDLREFHVNPSNYWINFTVDLYDDEKISKIEIDLLSEGGSWNTCYPETEEAKTEIYGYSESIRLLCIVWNPEKNAYDVYVYYDATNKRWVNHTIIRIEEENVTTYKFTIDESVFKGKVRIYVENEKHIRIEWTGNATEATEYLGVWVMDNERNQNATVFEAGKCEEARIIPVEMRPICNKTEEVPTPEFTRPATYIEIEGRYFKLRDYIALQFAGFWSNLSISVGDYSWYSIGSGVAHAFVIPVSDWNAFDDARIEVSADGIEVRGFVRVVYWWEDWRYLLFFGILIVLFCLLGVAYMTSRRRKK